MDPAARAMTSDDGIRRGVIARLGGWMMSALPAVDAFTPALAAALDERDFFEVSRLAYALRGELSRRQQPVAAHYAFRLFEPASFAGHRTLTAQLVWREVQWLVREVGLVDTAAVLIADRTDAPTWGQLASAWDAADALGR